MVTFVFLSMLNMLILVAYYRLGKKQSNRAKQIVTSTLRTESLATSHLRLEDGSEQELA